jgi:hypothetical protein
MKNVGMKAGIGGALGIGGLALCCALPGLGIATAAGLGAGMGLWTESILGGILVGIFVLIGVAVYKRAKAKSRTASENEGAAIACDPTVFSKEERIEHAALAENVLLRWPFKREETTQGYIFHYHASEAPFNEIAKWVIDEQRCCPWGTYALETSSSSDGKAGIRLSWNGGAIGKPFLTDALQELEKSGGKGFEQFLNTQGKITRFQTKTEKSSCGC